MGIALDDLGNPRAPVGSRDWIRDAQIVIHSSMNDATSTIRLIQSKLKSIQKTEAYKHLDNEFGHPFASFKQFVETRFPIGLGSTMPVIQRIIDESNPAMTIAVIRQAEALGPLEEHGGEREGALPDRAGPGRGHKQDKTQGSYNYLEFYDNAATEDTQQDRSDTYLIRRALRDCPERVEALRRGEYPSVRAMAIAAGFVKLRDQVTWLTIEGLARSLERKLSPSDIATLCNQLMKGKA